MTRAELTPNCSNLYLNNPRRVLAVVVPVSSNFADCKHASNPMKKIAYHQPRRHQNPHCVEGDYRSSFVFGLTFTSWCLQIRTDSTDFGTSTIGATTSEYWKYALIHVFCRRSNCSSSFQSFGDCSWVEGFGLTIGPKRASKGV